MVRAPDCPKPKLGTSFTCFDFHHGDMEAMLVYRQGDDINWSGILVTDQGQYPVESNEFSTPRSKGHWRPSAWIFCDTYHMFHPPSLVYDKDGGWVTPLKVKAFIAKRKAAKASKAA